MPYDIQVFGPNGGTYNLDWLRQNYGAGIQVHQVSGPRFELRQINIMTSGDTLIRIWVFDKDGKSKVGQPVTYTFPDLANPSPDLAPIVGNKSGWSSRGVLNKNRVDGRGMVDFQIGKDSWIKNQRGPYSAFVLSPSIASDCIEGIGWLGGTNHQGPTELFFYETDGAPPPAPDPQPEPEPEPPPASGDLAAVQTQLQHIAARLDALARHLGLPA